MRGSYCLAKGLRQVTAGVIVSFFRCKNNSELTCLDLVKTKHGAAALKSTLFRPSGSSGQLAARRAQLTVLNLDIWILKI